MNNKLKLIIAGFIIGFSSGFFTGGGGILSVLFLTHLFHLDAIESRVTTIFCIFPLVLCSLFIYKSSNLLDFNLGYKCAIGGLIGGGIGSILLNKLSNKYLELGFIIFILMSSFIIFFTK